MSSAGDWCLIESDPGVFNELIQGFGVSGVQVEELFDLDLDYLRSLNPVHGLIFLFKYHTDEQPAGTLDHEATDVYFAQQVINNACATQAILNLLLNVSHSDVKLGAILDNFKQFSVDLDPATRGLCLSNSQEIRALHNSFAAPNSFDLEGPKHGKEDAYHFVTYVPVNNVIYELDGLKAAPNRLGPVPEGKDWLEVVHSVLTARISTHNNSEITFNLMAVVGDRKEKYQKQLTQLNESDIDSEIKKAEASRLNELIQEESKKFARYKAENQRRRHNYTPFIIELLKILAKENRLNGLIEKAVKRQDERAAARQKK